VSNSAANGQRELCQFARFLAVGACRVITVQGGGQPAIAELMDPVVETTSNSTTPAAMQQAVGSACSRAEAAENVGDNCEHGAGSKGGGNPSKTPKQQATAKHTEVQRRLDL